MKTFFNMIVSFIAFAVAAFTGSRPTFTRRDPCAGANVYSAEYTNAYITTPPVKNSAAQQGGRIRIFRATYTQGASAGTIGDIVYFGVLPNGATRIPGGKCFFSTGAASSTMKIGMVGADADMVAVTAVTTAGSFALDVFAASGAVSKLTADTAVIGTVAGAGLAANQVLTVWQPYVLND
jgi:hypothetical protein